MKNNIFFFGALLSSIFLSSCGTRLAVAPSNSTYGKVVKQDTSEQSQKTILPALYP